MRHMRHWTCQPTRRSRRRSSKYPLNCPRSLSRKNEWKHPFQSGRSFNPSTILRDGDKDASLAFLFLCTRAHARPSELCSQRRPHKSIHKRSVAQRAWHIPSVRSVRERLTAVPRASPWTGRGSRELIFPVQTFTAVRDVFAQRKIECFGWETARVFA